MGMEMQVLNLKIKVISPKGRSRIIKFESLKKYALFIDKLWNRNVYFEASV
jgi:hypothetical protein